jgi:ferredoxin
VTGVTADSTRSAGLPGPAAATRFDLLRVPLLGRFLKWRWSRVTMQTCVLLVSVVMVGHAFFGPQLAPKNLAALLTWVHFRGLVVLVLLLGGNFFCMACPFLLPRQFARHFAAPRWNWPTWLRNKWPAIVLFVVILFVYELFDLWSNPWWTGILIVAYFSLAFVIDVLFKHASFCKFVCPVGQFNFLSSSMSPLEVTVRDHQVCATCTTKDCIRGRRAEAAPTGEGPQAGGELPIIQRGCELALFQPRKLGNLDCTFCLDCVYACPYDNVGILSRLPGESLGEGGMRSGIGDLDRRPDWTALTIVFVFGALLNAFAMVSPVYALEQWVARVTGLRVEWPILGGLFLAVLVLEPLLLLGGAAALTRTWTGAAASVWTIVNRFARALVPFGFGVWLAHYGFHFFTGALTVVPVTQLAARNLVGWPVLGQPQWQWGGLPETIVFPIEIGFLCLGLLGTWLVAWRIATRFCPAAPWRAFLPWAAVGLLLFATACWILNQPMDMRGTFLG